jgi:hypothetical protein
VHEYSFPRAQLAWRSGCLALGGAVIDFKSCDFETCLIRPALQSPPIVCMSTATADGGEIFATSDVAREFSKLVTEAADGKLAIVGHNFAYDAGCALQWVPGIAEPLFAAYDRGTILDTGIFERIAEIGKFTPRKELSLERVGAAYGITVVKDPSVRLGYGQFYGRPLSDYPEAFSKYPVDDAENTLNLWDRQLKRHGKHVQQAVLAWADSRLGSEDRCRAHGRPTQGSGGDCCGAAEARPGGWLRASGRHARHGQDQSGCE